MKKHFRVLRRKIRKEKQRKGNRREAEVSADVCFKIEMFSNFSCTKKFIGL
jgi:hypothetical protein